MAVTEESSRHIVYTHSFATPIGTLHSAVDRKGSVLGLSFGPVRGFPAGTAVEVNKYACGELEYQIEEYFAGNRESFSVEIRFDGTDFQRTVWSRLMKIGFGETVTYGEIARKIGRRDAARAVGCWCRATGWCRPTAGSGTMRYVTWPKARGAA